MSFQNSMIKPLAMNIEKQKMNRAIITLTKGAAKLGLRLLKEYEDSILYVNKRFPIEGERIEKINEGIGKLIASIFPKYRCLIFIMASGIVVRSIAPHLEDKAKDPAVIVMDERGRNVISLLSGHLGRANEITLDIARRLNSNPVITTASDINNTLAVDTLAMKLGLTIENFKAAAAVTSHIVNGERVGIISKYDLNLKLPRDIVVLNDTENTQGLKGIIEITNEKETLRSGLDRVVLRPRNIVLGVGCRKGKKGEEIIRAIETSLDAVKKSELSIKHIATVDVKKDEKGLLDAANYYGVLLEIVSRESIKAIENNFKTSDFVRKSIGVGAVAEPTAFITADNGSLIMKKTRYNGITIAIVEEGGI